MQRVEKCNVQKSIEKFEGKVEKSNDKKVIEHLITDRDACIKAGHVWAIDLKCYKYTAPVTFTLV
jgi:hypothetical protein